MLEYSKKLISFDGNSIQIANKEVHGDHHDESNSFQ